MREKLTHKVKVILLLSKGRREDTLLATETFSTPLVAKETLYKRKPRAHWEIPRELMCICRRNEKDVLAVSTNP